MYIQTRVHIYIEKALQFTLISLYRPIAEEPCVKTGLQGLRLLKTTQSSFVNFVSDEFRSLPDMKDRIFSTVVSAAWQYNKSKGVDFGKIW